MATALKQDVWWFRVWRWLRCRNRFRHGFGTFLNMEWKEVPYSVDPEGWRSYGGTRWRCKVCGAIGESR